MSGKYSSRMAEYFDDKGMNGCADAQTGDVDTIGHYQLFTFTDEDRVRYINETGGYEIAANIVGCIIHTDSQGFVDVWPYMDAGQLTRDWADLESEYADAMGDEE